jgi:hypothetical protein
MMPSVWHRLNEVKHIMDELHKILNSHVWHSYPSTLLTQVNAAGGDANGGVNENVSYCLLVQSMQLKRKIECRLSPLSTALDLNRSS